MLEYGVCVLVLFLVFIGGVVIGRVLCKDIIRPVGDAYIIDDDADNSSYVALGLTPGTIDNLKTGDIIAFNVERIRQ